MEKSYGRCPICQQGDLLAVKDKETSLLLLMCDDCESQWASEEAAQSYANALKKTIAVLPATDDDIARSQWLG